MNVQYVVSTYRKTLYVSYVQVENYSTTIHKKKKIIK